MDSNLIEINNYGVITFSSTSYALKAEKVMKKIEKPHMIIPTPREISASCGLALKLKQSFVEEYYQILVGEKVPVEGVYMIDVEGRNKILHKITFDPSQV